MRTSVVKIILFFVILLAGTTGRTQTVEFLKTVRPGMALFVYAHDGLSLRSKPDISGAVVAVVRFAEGVQVVPDATPSVSITNSGISGAWIKVKYGDKEGYQFSGFLSRFSPMTYSKGARPTGELERWVLLNFPSKSVSDTAPKDGATYNAYKMIQLKNNGTYELSCPEGGCDITLALPVEVITYQEMFLISRLAYPEFFDANSCPYAPEHLKCDGENSSLDLMKNGGMYSVHYSFAD